MDFFALWASRTWWGFNSPVWNLWVTELDGSYVPRLCFGFEAGRR